MNNSIHISKSKLCKSKGQISLPLADARELTDVQKLQLNEKIANILSQKGRENA